MLKMAFLKSDFHLEIGVIDFFKSNFPFLKIDYIPIIRWIETWRKTTKPEDQCLSLKQC